MDWRVAHPLEDICHLRFCWVKSLLVAESNPCSSAIMGLVPPESKEAKANSKRTRVSLCWRTISRGKPHGECKATLSMVVGLVCHE
jgi:hypothetical protein